MKKICIIFTYFGKWPAYFPVFLQSCRLNKDVDFFFFTDCSTDKLAVPENTKFIPGSLNEFNNLASHKLGTKIGIQKPYKVCDLRPAFGVIFEDYLAGYDFWAYSDIDVIYGNIRSFLTREILAEYDVISARKEYMVGSFSVFRNHEKINTLFRQSHDFEKIISSDEAYFFDEAGYGCWNMVLHPEQFKAYPSSLDSISHIINRNVATGHIKAFFSTMVRERLELSFIDKKPWLLQWEKGSLTDTKTRLEYLYFHMIGFKEDKNFSITNDYSFEELLISSKGIFSDSDLKTDNESVLQHPPEQDLNISIVIPCYNESDLLKTLDSIFACIRPECATEVIIVINSSENAASQAVLQNIRSYRQILEWMHNHPDKRLTFLPLFFPAIPLK